MQGWTASYFKAKARVSARRRALTRMRTIGHVERRCAEILSFALYFGGCFYRPCFMEAKHLAKFCIGIIVIAVFGKAIRCGD